jgi:hypothetical protein
MFGVLEEEFHQGFGPGPHGYMERRVACMHIIIITLFFTGTFVPLPCKYISVQTFLQGHGDPDRSLTQCSGFV